MGGGATMMKMSHNMAYIAQQQGRAHASANVFGMFEICPRMTPVRGGHQNRTHHSSTSGRCKKANSCAIVPVQTGRKSAGQTVDVFECTGTSCSHVLICEARAWYSAMPHVFCSELATVTDKLNPSNCWLRVLFAVRNCFSRSFCGYLSLRLAVLKNHCFHSLCMCAIMFSVAACRTCCNIHQFTTQKHPTCHRTTASPDETKTMLKFACRTKVSGVGHVFLCYPMSACV